MECNHLFNHCFYHLCGSSSPVDLIGPNPFRLIYCAVLGCWGADVVNNSFNYSLYYTSKYSLLDSFDFFGMIHRQMQSRCSIGTAAYTPSSPSPPLPSPLLYCTVLSPTVIVLSQALVYYPVFACVSAPIPAFGHIIGFLYTSLMLVLYLKAHNY